MCNFATGSGEKSGFNDALAYSFALTGKKDGHAILYVRKFAYVSV